MSRRSAKLRWAGALALCVGVADASVTLAASPGTLSDSPAFWWRWTSAVALCAVLALGGALAVSARARGLTVRGVAREFFSRWTSPQGPGARPGKRLRILETVRLSPQSQLILVRLDERDLLIAATPTGAVLLTGATSVDPGPVAR